VNIEVRPHAQRQTQVNSCALERLGRTSLNTEYS